LKSNRERLERETPLKASILIIGYGNPLRSDDGLGLVVAERLSTIPEIAGDDSIEITKSHQLMPELAETIARSALVLFIDAAVAAEGHTPGSMQSSVLESNSRSSVTLGHHCTPSELISFSAALFGGHPRALVVSLTAESFDYGDQLTPVVQEAIPSLIEFIRTQILTFRRGH